MSLENLKNQVGREYKMFFDDGNYEGCFYPVYFLYPNLPRYPLPNIDVKAKENFTYGIKKILKSFKRVDKKDAEKGDMFACDFDGELHVGILLEGDKLIHVFRGHTLKIDRLSFYQRRFKNLMFFRRR